MNETIPSLPAVLTFAATDPTSGAGLQADLLALASMGCYPLSVVTALTVQDTAGVEAFLPIDPDWVADQARCILEDMPVAAFKMGMLGSTEIVTVVAEVVSDYPDVPLVLDPVFASGRGDEFAGGGVLRADTWQRLPGSFHGSGCTLASALAANLARGLDIGDAVYEAQDYTWHALRDAAQAGGGTRLSDGPRCA